MGPCNLFNLTNQNYFSIELRCYQQAMGGATIQSSAIRDVDMTNTEELNLHGGTEEVLNNKLIN